MNTLMIKEALTFVISHLSATYEDAGMDGDVELAQELCESLAKFISASNELDLLNNVDIIPSFVETIFNEHINSVSYEEFKAELNLALGRLRQAIRKQEEQHAKLFKLL